MNKYEEKKAARIERYQGYADNAGARSTSAYQRSNAATEGIPFGQPILVGHHSERGHRAAIKRSHQAMDKSVEEGKKSAYWAAKAEAAENNTAIDSADPEAVTKLKEKLEKLEKIRTMMKAANKIIKSKKLGQAEKIMGLVKLGIEETKAKLLFEPDFCGRVGFPSYEITNRLANIKRIHGRIKFLSNKKDFEPFEINGITVELEDGQIQVRFPGIPEKEIRTKLKSYPISLKWSRYETAWVRKQTESTGNYFLNDLKELLKEVA